MIGAYMHIQNYQQDWHSDNTLVYSCQYHVIWCTKYRRSVFDDTMQERLQHLICSRQTDWDYRIRAVDVMADHVHMVIENNPKVSIAQTVGKIKAYTSKTMREEFPQLKSRLPTLWTRSKFIFSVGSVTLDVVKRYIEDQKNV